MDKITAKGRAWLLYLLVGVLATAVYFLLPSTFAQSVCLAIVDASAVVAIAARLHLHRPVHPSPWYFFAFGIGLVLVGDIVWAGYTLRVGPPYPSVADVFYLLGVLVFLVGLLLVGGWGLSKHAASLIDLLIVATGVAMLSWVLVLQPRFDPGSSLPLEPLLLVVYLLLYVMMLAIVVRPLIVPAKRVPALYLICAAPAILVASETAYGSLASGDYEAYVAGSPVYVGQLFFLALLGTAALHPSMAPLTEPVPPAPAELVPRTRAKAATRCFTLAWEIGSIRRGCSPPCATTRRRTWGPGYWSVLTSLMVLVIRREPASFGPEAARA